MDSTPNTGGLKLKAWKQGDFVAELAFDFIKGRLQMGNEILAQKIVISNAHYIQIGVITGFGECFGGLGFSSGSHSLTDPVANIRRGLHPLPAMESEAKAGSPR